MPLVLLLRRCAELSKDFTPPIGACPTFHAFYGGLHEFEQDLHQHIHFGRTTSYSRARSGWRLHKAKCNQTIWFGRGTHSQGNIGPTDYRNLAIWPAV